MECYGVRHGQTEWNAIRKLQGELDSPLTAEGVAQTAQLKVALPLPFDRCITSPLGRARQTAELLCGGAIAIEEDPLLAEMRFGSVEGLEKEAFKARYPEAFHALWHHADRYDPSAFGGESFDSLAARAQQFLDSLYGRDDERLLIVSHGMMLKMLFGLVWQHDLSQFWQDPVPLNTSITHFRIAADVAQMIEFSNVAHLDDTEVISYV